MPSLVTPPPPGPASSSSNSAVVGPSGSLYTSACDPDFSEPGACDFTPLAVYPDSTTWIDGVTVPAQLENTQRPYLCVLNILWVSCCAAASCFGVYLASCLA